MKWMVAYPREFGCCPCAQEVEADDMRVNAGGCLVFKDANGHVILAYAPGQWTRVSEGGIERWPR